MADKSKLALETWWRYQYLRDNGHLNYVTKVKKCENFFAGMQWEKSDLELLKDQKRPALTINKILSTLANITGEQIFNRTEISFRPRRSGATEDIADALTRVFMQIGDNNQLQWCRTDVYMDGLIGSRGFFDVRLGFTDSLQGEATVTQINPKNVLIDSDASSYDPDGWNDVIITKWLSLEEIEATYGKKWRTRLENQSSEMTPYSYDESDWERDQFGTPPSESLHYMDSSSEPKLRVVRVLERQWKKLDSREHFVHIPTGEIREIPDGWTADDVSAFLGENSDYTTIKRTAPRIRWTVCAGREVLHDDWSPYKYFTVVPFFPYFRRGKTIGIVENLLGPQELLNKVSSQELHVVNTSANSGWKIKGGSLQNMDVSELESRGAQTGVVLELDEVSDAEKIQPNQIPTGLERVSYKAEEHIKTISGVPDAATGFSREDVSAKALKANQVRANANFAVVQDNLNRTDYFLARSLLDLVQTYYTEERLIYITTDPLRQKSETMKVNEVSPEGEIIRDLTLGEYDIVVTNQPDRDTLEDSAFAQGVEMRKELNINIPDSFLIQNSRMPDKATLIEAIEAQSNSEETKRQREVELARQEAEVGKIQSDTRRDDADSQLKTVKAQQEALNARMPVSPETELRIEAELAAKKYEIDMGAQLEREKMQNQIVVEQMKLQKADSKPKEPEPKKEQANA